MKKKKLMAASLSLALVLGLTACGGGNSAKTDSSSADAGSAVSESVEEPEVTEEPEATEEPEVTEGPEQPDETSPAASGSADVSSAVDASTSTDTAGIPVGQWAKIARYATEDECYHTVYARVTKATTFTEDAAYIQAAVDANNANGSDWDQIDLASENFQIPSDVEWCLMEYEVYVPEDFPAPDYGMVEPSLSFSEENIGGGGTPSADGTSTYIGLGTNNFELAVYSDDTKFTPGNTYIFQNLFTMVKGYENYAFETSSYPDGMHSDDISADSMYYAYFANK